MFSAYVLNAVCVTDHHSRITTENRVVVMFKTVLLNRNGQKMATQTHVGRCNHIEQMYACSRVSEPAGVCQESFLRVRSWSDDPVMKRKEFI